MKKTSFELLYEEIEESIQDFNNKSPVIDQSLLNNIDKMRDSINSSFEFSNSIAETLDVFQESSNQFKDLISDVLPLFNARLAIESFGCPQPLLFDVQDYISKNKNAEITENDIINFFNNKSEEMYGFIVDSLDRFAPQSVHVFIESFNCFNYGLFNSCLLGIFSTIDGLIYEHLKVNRKHIENTMEEIIDAIKTNDVAPTLVILSTFSYLNRVYENANNFTLPESETFPNRNYISHGMSNIQYSKIHCIAAIIALDNLLYFFKAIKLQV